MRASDTDDENTAGPTARLETTGPSRPEPHRITAPEDHHRRRPPTTRHTADHALDHARIGRENTAQ